VEFSEFSLASPCKVSIPGILLVNLEGFKISFSTIWFGIEISAPENLFYVILDNDSVLLTWDDWSTKANEILLLANSKLMYVVQHCNVVPNNNDNRSTDDCGDQITVDGKLG